MTKDPAFLFYYQDFAYGTRKMTFEEKGAYIELLCEQADSGHLSIDDIKRILKNSFPIWDAICSKFSVDENGKYYNEVLEKHIQKRKKYTESRKNNLKGSHMKSHMESHMVNVNVNVNKNINKEEEEKTVDVLWTGTFGRKPKLPELELTQQLIDKYGYDKTYEIFKKAVLEGFNKIQTLVNSLDEKGNIKPKVKEGEKHTGRVISKKEDEEWKKVLAENEAKLKKQGIYNPKDDPEYLKLIRG